MSWEAGAAGTKMFPKERRPNMYPLGQAVDGMLRDLGQETLTYGPFSHDYSMAIFRAAPISSIHKMVFSAMVKSYHRDIERIR